MLNSKHMNYTAPKEYQRQINNGYNWKAILFHIDRSDPMQELICSICRTNEYK